MERVALQPVGVKRGRGRPPGPPGVLDGELRTLRVLVRDTRAAVKDGTVHLTAGAAIIVQSVSAIARITFVQHRLKLSAGASAKAERLNNEVDRLLRELGLGEGPD